MALNAAAVAGLGQPGAAAASVARKASAVDGFADALGKLIDGVEKTTAGANTAVSNMLEKKVDVHDAMIALHEAETTLQLTVQIRNKLVQAYQDIMRMPI
jgi:flagellar hook-basal body complex protein FliE